MSGKAIDYKVILKRDGQTQQQRMPAWLNPALVPIDDRTKEQFFEYLKQVVARVNFFDMEKVNRTLLVNGSWQDFFNLSTNELNELAAKASLPPHIALWHAFMDVYTHAQRHLNAFTARHLNFYYGEVLLLKKHLPVPAKVHVLFELKKNTPNTLIETGAALLAGKDALKKDLHYTLQHDIVVNTSMVAQLRSLYVNPSNKNYLHYAPVAKSADGLGGELDPANPKWNAFGNSALPLAKVGFCLASDVLKMKEGERTIKVHLTLANLPATAKSAKLTSNLFLISVTGEKGWIGPKAASVEFSSGDDKVYKASFTFSVDKEEAAVVGYDAKVHGNDFKTTQPILQVLLNDGKADFGYSSLQGAELQNATIEVIVNGIKNLQLQNDFGTLDPKKPFTPYGSSPDVNANFVVQNEEAFTKRLKEFSLDVEWKNIPEAKLANYFSGYEMSNNRNQDFTAMASFHDAFGWKGTQTVNLFNTTNATTAVKWTFGNGLGLRLIARRQLPEISVVKNMSVGYTMQQKLINHLGHVVPGLSVLKPVVVDHRKTTIARRVRAIALEKAPTVKGWVNPDTDRRTGHLNLSLRHSFLFKEYRKKYTENILAFTKGKASTIDVINEPFAPEIQDLKFNYVASTAKVNFTGTLLNDFVDEEIELFHFGAFGQMREHGYQRSQHNFLNNTTVKLLPQYNNEGEFFIGLSGLAPGDSACILFQVAEGSADPDKPKVEPRWSVLCDNYWKEMTSDELIFDTTNGLLTSGVIKFVIATQATTVNTIMPDGLLWLKAALSTDSNAVCLLHDVHSNAAIAQFDNRENDPQHLAAPMPAKTITKLENEVGAIKTIAQPYASFGGAMHENDQSYYIRVSERLRHKQRSIALWDVERVLLQQFPQLHKVKCINHATENSFYAPGNTLVVLVPDLTNQNAVDPLQPRVDKNTVTMVQQYLKQHSTAWATHHVRNPFYEPVRIAVTLKLKTGSEFNYYQKVIDQKLQEFLSPWIAGATSDIHFAGKVTKSMVVKLLEDMDVVDYLAALTLQHFTATGNFSNAEVIEASNPAAILVSAANHTITNYTGLHHLSADDMLNNAHQ